MSSRVWVSLCFIALSGCGVAARVGAGIGGNNANYAPQAAATVGVAAGSSTLNILAGLTGVFGVTPRPPPIPVGHVAGLVEATYFFTGSNDVAKWGIRGGLGVGPNFDGTRGVGWQTFARVGPLYALTDASDYLTALGLELMIGVTGFPKAELFWGVNFNIGWFFKVIERFPAGG